MRTGALPDPDRPWLDLDGAAGLPRLHLISGLPRSGSTLLSAILRQNPRFSAGVTTPVAALIGALMPRMSGNSEFAPFFVTGADSRALGGGPDKNGEIGEGLGAWDGEAVAEEAIE